MAGQKILRPLHVCSATPVSPGLQNCNLTWLSWALSAHIAIMGL